MQQPLFAKLVGLAERHRFTAAALATRPHSQLSPWAKIITRVDHHQHAGYRFIGPWISRGYTDTNTLTLPLIALVSLEHPRPLTRLTYRTYHVLCVHSTGHISITDSETDDLTRGWSDRILPTITTLLTTLDTYNRTNHPIAGNRSINRILLKPEIPIPPTTRFSKPLYPRK